METTVLPRSAGTFGMSRRVTSRNESARPRTSLIPSAPRSSIPSRCFTVPPSLVASVPVVVDGLPDLDAVVAVALLEVDPHVFVPFGREVLADVVGPDRQLPVAPVDEDGQLHRPGAAEVDNGVHGRPDRPAGEEDVVAQHDDLLLHVAGQLRGAE